MPFDPPPIFLPDTDRRPFTPWLDPFRPLSVIPTAPQETDLERWLWSYVQVAWPIMRPGLVIEDGKYLEGLCLHLQAITDPVGLSALLGGKVSPEDLGIKHLISNFEPRGGKSDLLALWASWEWGPRRMAYLRHLVGIHRADAVEETQTALMRLILGPWYQQRWGAPQGEHLGVQASHLWSWARFNLTAGGGRQVVSRRKAIQGLPAHRLIIEDLIGDVDIDSAAVRRRTHRWRDRSFRTRGIQKLDTPTVISEQRLHANDTTQDLITEEGLRSGRHPSTGFQGVWDKLVFQTEFTRQVSDTPLTRAGLWKDDRAPGQYLRKMWRPDTIALLKRKPALWASQYQQDPEIAATGRAWPSFLKESHGPLSLAQIAAEVPSADVRIVLTVDEGHDDPVFALIEAYCRVECPTCDPKHRGYQICDFCGGRGCQTCAPSRRIGLVSCLTCEARGWGVRRWSLAEYMSQPGQNRTADNAAGIDDMLRLLGLTLDNGHGNPSLIDDFLIDNMLAKPGGIDTRSARTEADALRMHLRGLPQWVGAGKYKGIPRRITYRQGDALFAAGHWMVDVERCPILAGVLSGWCIDSPHDEQSHGAACAVYATALMHAKPVTEAKLY